MLQTKASSWTPGSIRRFVQVVFVAILMASGCVLLGSANAEAGKRSRVITAVGVGAAAAIILNEMARDKPNKTYSSKTYQRKKSQNRAAKSSTSKSRKSDTAAKPKRDKDEPVNEPDDAAEPSKELPPDDTPAVQAASTGPTISTKDEIIAAQEHLKFMGYDVPEADGLMDEKTVSAIKQFQESIKEPVTGSLTTSQLQLLFVKVAGQQDGNK